MNEKLQKIAQLTREIPIVIPPGAFLDYPKSGLTYLVSTEGENEILADNPYILEYLLYNNKKDWVEDISHLFYIGRESIKQSKSEHSNFVFFFDSIMHFLDFEISRKELPVFKIFIDHLSFYRKSLPTQKNALQFPWKFNTFNAYSRNVTHNLEPSEVFDLHQKICSFHREHFPEEAIKNLFES